MKARMMISPMSGSLVTRRRAGAAGDQDLSLVELVELAAELSLAVRANDARRAVVGVVEDLDAAFQDEEEIDAALAPREQHRAGSDALGVAVFRHALGHLRTQPGKRLAFARPRVGRIQGLPGRRSSGADFAHRPSLRKLRPAVPRPNGLGGCRLQAAMNFSATPLLQ
jgi:hypothetical protein